MIRPHEKAWWGAPRKFSTNFVERKICWLELFYDLVYVIAISTITHALVKNPGLSGILDYFYLFALIFWGWLNGSLYYDLHGTQGVRTRLMTLWQMLLVTALVVTYNGNTQIAIKHNGTIVILLLQLYITYLWWSVGIYDKAHRKLNRPYTICYLLSFLLIFSSFYVQGHWYRIVFYLSILLNYSPAFILTRKLRAENKQLNLSSSMTERLGLLTIILFGETILGVINGTTELKMLDLHVWIIFSLGVLIIFLLWWIFFGTVADRESKKGKSNANATQMAYLPTLLFLGLAGAGFSTGFHEGGTIMLQKTFWTKQFIGIPIAGFLLSITALSNYLEFPEVYEQKRKQMQTVLITSAVIIALLCFLNLPVIWNLLLLLLVLIAIIFFMINLWVKVQNGTAADENNL